MQVVLITGATGFVGSALAASLLARSIDVVAVSRNDTDGRRTVAAVRDAAEGFGLDIDGAGGALTVLDVDPSDLEGTLRPQALRDVTHAWHAAAEMSYSNNKIVHGFQTNIGATATLYQILDAHAPRCRRFFYVSTAYTAGMRGGYTPEALHPGSRCINAYQITKWGAELALHNLHLTHRLPVTLFRPTIVVGHRDTGWARRNGFGMYMFIDAVNMVGRAGYNAVTLDLDPQAHPDIVPIDLVVEDAVALTLRAGGGRDFEVLHCAGGHSLTVGDVLAAIGDASNVRVSFGPPETLLDQQVDRAIETNRPFANTEWRFDRRRLDSAVGRETRPPAFDRDSLRRVVGWYLGCERSAPVAVLESA